MTKVKKITVSNLKAVSKLTADFNGCTAIITGGNNKGKSSFLKSLPERLRGVKPETILKEGEKEGFAEWELTTGEKFIWTFDGKKEKLSFITERNIKQSVTKDLCKAYFPPVFDVDEFLNSAPAKQKKVLQELTGIDFTEIDRTYKAAYEDRTYANKKADEEKAKCVLIDPDVDMFESSYDDLEKELAGIDSHNILFTIEQNKIAEKKSQVERNTKRIEDLAQEIRTLEAANIGAGEAIEKIELWCAVETNKPKPVEYRQELKDKIQKIKDDNKLISDNNKAIEQKEAYEKALLNAQELDAEVKRIEAEKMDYIKNASMPDGFGFSDDGITYHGYPFNKESLSSSGIYIAALKLAAIGLGEVRTLHFDASFLDKKSLAEIEAWATENKLQLLIERPDFEGGEIEYQLLNEEVK